MAKEPPTRPVRPARSGRTASITGQVQAHHKTDANANRPVRKIGYIDLMKIADPSKARKSLTDGALAFPFWTIENVDVIDPQHIVVGNDNNLRCSIRSRFGLLRMLR